MSKAVEKAVVAKCCLYCKRVLKKVTIKISGRYQKLIATKGEARSIISLSKPIAIAFVAIEGKIFTKSVNITIMDKNILNICAKKTALCFDFAYAGIKTCVKAPSAKIRRKRFGSLNAIKNISLYIFAPRTDAVKRSLKNPKTLENKIPKLLVKIDLNIGFFCRIWTAFKTYWIFLNLLTYYFYESLTNI